FQTTRVDGKAVASQFIDYDNDGLLDLVSVDGGLQVLRNTGNAWADVSSTATTKIKDVGGGMMAAGDIDGCAWRWKERSVIAVALVRRLKCAREVSRKNSKRIRRRLRPHRLTLFSDSANEQRSMRCASFGRRGSFRRK